MNRSRVVLVTGLSGAGKTSAMAVLEDMGYYCIDRFPASMINDLAKDIVSGSFPQYENVALSVSAADFNVFYNELRNVDCELMVLYLEASKEQLLLRYKYNRRNHPLVVSGVANSLDDAIIIELEEFSKIKSFATIIIDTTFLNGQLLTSRIQRFFNLRNQKHTMTLSFTSFGYRKGLPLDADLVFDVRFLKNPYWDETLRLKSGNDMQVYSYVIEDSVTQEFIGKLKDFLDYMLEKNMESSKHLFSIAIGCTGGQHRSVSIVNWLYEQYRLDFNVIKDHRDVKEEVL